MKKSYLNSFKKRLDRNLSANAWLTLIRQFWGRYRHTIMFIEITFFELELVSLTPKHYDRLDQTEAVSVVPCQHQRSS